VDLGLAGKTAIITGASKGIGYGVAESLGRESCKLHLVARDKEMLESAAARLKSKFDVDVTIHPTDLSVSGSATKLLAQTGVPDILVNNAGAIPGGDLLDVDEEIWRSAWDLKVFGYINLARQAFEAMKAQGFGVIANITGLAGDKPDFSYIAGTAGNASLNAFTRALGSYSLEYGVRVFAVSPGPVETERLVGLMKTRAKTDTGSEDGWRTGFSGMPMGRAAKVEEIADVVAFLVSERASYVSGTVLTIDGGHGSRGGSFSK